MRSVSAYVNLNANLAPRSPKISHRRQITMAKNKNRKQSGDQNRASAAEQAQEQAKSSASEAQSTMETQAMGSPADVARKHQRRFGHN
jgi:hypothetical protein